MAYIIGLGTPTDPTSLKMETRRHRYINNSMRPEAPPDLMRGRIRMNLEAFPNAKPMSASAIYNCYGLAFACRRSAIVDEEDVSAILVDDGYRQLPWDPSAWLSGDIVIYRDGNGAMVHVGVVAKKQVDLATGETSVEVVSAWGESGEYLHPIGDVPSLLGRPTEVVAQRFLYDQ